MPLQELVVAVIVTLALLTVVWVSADDPRNPDWFGPLAVLIVVAIWAAALVASPPPSPSVAGVEAETPEIVSSEVSP